MGLLLEVYGNTMNKVEPGRNVPFLHPELLFSVHLFMYSCLHHFVVGGFQLTECN